jgi:hypothetical protein
LCLCRTDIFRDGDALCLKHGKSAPGNFRIGIGDAPNHTRNSRLDERGGARPGASLVGARLKAHIGRSPFGKGSRTTKSFHFGMGTAARLRPAPPHDARPAWLILADNDAAHSRIGRNTAKPPRGERKGMSHELRVMWPHGHGRIPISRCQARHGPQQRP